MIDHRKQGNMPPQAAALLRILELGEREIAQGKVEKAADAIRRLRERHRKR